MCGIVAYLGGRPAASVVMEGLRRVAYRGYDSAGVAVASEAGAPLEWLKRAGKISVLEEALERAPLAGYLALGHTRWATHGRPDDVNAHPHVSEDGRLALVHNGIIENYLPLRERLRASGHHFRSQTDSEVVLHLIEEAFQGDLAAALRAALAQVRGSYAVVVAHTDSAEVVAARHTSPLVVGHGDGEQWLASDVTALLPFTRHVTHLQDGDVVVLGRGGVRLTDLQGREVERPRELVDWDAETAEKDGYEHFMLKEIAEQPSVVRRALAGRITDDASDVELGLSLEPHAIDRVIVTAAGTASYAGGVGAALIESLARVPASVEVASEMRYRDPVIDARTLVIAVSQSGETVDTLAATREARRRGARTLAVLNVKGSTLSREVDDVLYLHAGPEVGVASTKAYMAMLTVLTLLAIRMGRATGSLDDTLAKRLLAGLVALPQALESALASRERIRDLAPHLAGARSALYLGRGVNVSTAFEGALKLKEISYVHAEAYPMGEMKHGPIALIEPDVPVVAIATDAERYDKTTSSLQELRARDGFVIAIASEGDDEIEAHASEVVFVPRVDELLSPMVNVVPLQLLAYESAVALGRDVDQPRNLAKSVTVE